MFFKETKESEQDIHRIFDLIIEKMKQRIALKKKSDPWKFAVPCLVVGIEFPCALCDKSSSVSILTKVMADHLGLKIDPSQDSFNFVDHSTGNSGGIIRDLEVQFGNALVPVDIHILENQNKNQSLLLGRAFMATVRAVCNMQTNQLCFTLIMGTKIRTDDFRRNKESKQTLTFRKVPDSLREPTESDEINAENM